MTMYTMKKVYLFVSENNNLANSNNYMDKLTTHTTLSNLICIMIIWEAETAKAEQVIILE